MYMVEIVEKQNYCWRWKSIVGKANWTAGTAVNTTEIITADPALNGKLSMSVINPSEETDLTVKIFETLDDVDHFITWYTIPRKQTQQGFVMQSHVRYLPPLGYGNIKIVLSNDQAVTTAFEATVILQKVD